MKRQILHRRPSPVYREVLSQAFRFAWTERRAWPLAFFAGLLMSGGMYDVLLRAVRNISEQGASIGQTAQPWQQFGAVLDSFFGTSSGFMRFTSGIQVVLVIALILLVVVGLSCMAQGGLVYAIGSAKRGKPATFLQSLRIGGGAFWPILALNALSISLIWVLRFLVAFPLYLVLDSTTQSLWLLYFVSFLVFVGLGFAISIIQIFALNAMILQGASLQQAVVRGYAMFKKHWVTAIETVAILFLIFAGVVALFVCVYFIAILPLIAAIVSAALLKSSMLLYGALGCAAVIFFAGIFAATSFITQLQYATWTLLYRKLGEGGVLPKLHRWMRALAGSYSVPR